MQILTWAVGFSCVLGGGCLPLEHSGLDNILNGLQSSWGAKVDLLLVSWSQGGSYLQCLEHSFCLH